MRQRITDLVQDLPRLGVASNPSLEHAYESGKLLHGAWLHTNPVAETSTLVLLHPEECGCDALTNELVLHG